MKGIFDVTDILFVAGETKGIHMGWVWRISDKHLMGPQDLFPPVLGS
jgi:hypothetical protein